MPSSLSIDLPVIDISQFPQELYGTELNNRQNHSLIASVREACAEWGFFRLINHGISADLLEKVESVSRQLVSMPDEGVTENGYSFVVLSSSDSVREISEKIWPGGNSNACETIQTYSSCLSDLAEKFMKIILLSLGLDAMKFYESVFRKYKASLRINHYAGFGKPVGEEAIRSHTDINTLTILYQDEAGGLEIRSKDGNWISVKPLSNSFIINIGDSLKVWSNGRYRSAEHRVVRNGWADRLSIGCFVRFTDERVISAPPELVDADNPRRYKPFVYSQFRSDFLETVKATREKKKTENLAKFIDQYAGV